LSQVAAIAAAVGLDIVQLHGSETADQINALRQSLPLIRAVHVEAGVNAATLASSLHELPPAAILLDTKVAGAVGGTGVTFDWNIAEELRAKHRMPFFLAGGLTVGNVAAAVQQVDPWGVDVSSGVETDGQKDIEKIVSFVRNAKSMRTLAM
jgi:phosphoribosylanthranilate isomerase